MNESTGGATLSILVAVADNGVIGRGGALPWRLKSDLRRFRALTMGHPLIMGRKTFDAIGKALDGRDTIVLTRGEAHGVQDGISAAGSFEKAIEIARACAARRGVNEIFVIGGAEIFAQAMPMTSRLYLTQVHASPQGDVLWRPPLHGWTAISREDRAAGPRDEFPVTDLILERALK